MAKSLTRLGFDPQIERVLDLLHLCHQVSILHQLLVGLPSGEDDVLLGWALLQRLDDLLHRQPAIGDG